MTPAVSVLMPTFDRAHFITRAVDSLLAQSFGDWELVIIDDGSQDGTAQVLAPYRTDERIRYQRTVENRGLGAALNAALEYATAPLIAYLPSDDLYFRDHLVTLHGLLTAHPEVVLAYTGVRHHYNRSSVGEIEGEPLQLVQVMHRRTTDRWMERWAWTTDDLEAMYWSYLRPHGETAGTGAITALWTDHPDQRHKIIREPEGGINHYRARYRVSHPLRFASTTGNRMDEVAHYQRFRDRPETPPASDGLTILLVGELAYNPERVLALEERGHLLYGLWMDRPYWYNTVGPLPFGHVQDLPRDGWRDAIRALQPDIIYGLLNWQAVPFAHEVLKAASGVPFVWHFKEGPFICLEKNTWPQLVDLYRLANGCVYCSPEMRQWIATAIPESAGRLSLDLDGDLPKADWFDAPRSPLLAESEGEIHTVVPGRPIGLHPESVVQLARNGIHLHFYGDFTQGQWVAWVERTRLLAPHHLHLHPTVDQGDWVREFSQYDAGWLHFFASDNEGDIRRANWDDLNYPARMATLAVAGLPMLQADNSGSIVATQTLARDRDLGLFATDMDDLAAQLRDTARLQRIRDNVWRERKFFTFDAHADRLIKFFRMVIAEAGRG